MKLLFVSSPVGPLGTGMGGGVELTMRNAALALSARNHKITVVAPIGSRLDNARVIEVPGELQPSAQHLDRSAPMSLPPDAVLANMWDVVRDLQTDHCLAVNFAYDWLPFYLTPFLQVPIAHLVSMGSLLDGLDSMIEQTAIRFPGSVAMHTHAQASTFAFAEQVRIIGNGLDIDLYPFNPRPERRLAWVGRIAPEKGLEDALAVAERTALPLDVLGIVEDRAYWQAVRERFPSAPVTYHGFLDTPDMVAILRRSVALLMTPKWTEAFGNVVMEALACGVPVISYRRGGPSEMLEDGVTGYLVEPDDIGEMVEAVAKAPRLDRRACRACAERDFSLEAMGTRYEHWFAGLITRAGIPSRLAAESWSAAD
jgi:UDP-glucose:tetrahydrobiopterin glucosyltransferase